jgi:phosphatidylserine decarboxylase
MYWILYLIPKKLLSRLVGFLVHRRLPGPLKGPLLRWFANRYRIDLSEAESPLNSYPSIGELFIRRLKPGLRPVGSTSVVHPADSVITQAGHLREGLLIQAKGITYKLEEFLGPIEAKSYLGGEFATYYLCPTDYHRVHSPVSGVIRRVAHLPGALWPVNEWSTTNIPNLFSVNERVIVEIETKTGPVAVVFVGATNVGQISLSFWPEFRSLSLRENRVWTREFTNQTIQKGEELGIFHMGSTIVLCLSPSAVPENWPALPVGKHVRVNASFPEAHR